MRYDNLLFKIKAQGFKMKFSKRFSMNVKVKKLNNCYQFLNILNELVNNFIHLFVVFTDLEKCCQMCFLS